MSQLRMLRNRSTAEFAVLVGAHILLGLLFLTTGYIRPDSVGVVSILRSAALDQDLLFFNEWARFGMIQNGLTWFKEVTALGTLANHWGPGTSLLAAPGYLTALLVSGWPADGFDGLPGMVLAWTSVALTCVTLALANQILREKDGLSAPMRSLVLAAILFGTPLFWYTFRLPLGTHAAGTFCIGVAAFLMRRGLAEHGYAIGLLLSFAAVTRIQHILLLAVVFFAALALRLPLIFLAKFVAGAAPPLLVQAVAWQVIYGTPFGPLVSGANLTGSTWAPFHSTNFMAVLFSPYHGLFSWAPVILLALAGWLLALRGENRNIAAIFLAMFVVTLVANASFDRYFWGGLSFGQRRFVDLAIPFAFGLGWLCAAFKRLAVPLMVLAAAWTMALTMAALSGSVSLSRYVSGPMLLQSVATSIPSLEKIRAPITNAGMILTSLAAIAILGFLIAALWLIRAHWQAIATVYLLVCALTFAAMGPGTRARIDSNLQRFAINRAAAAHFGPLTDQRQLLLDEIEYLERTNRIVEAEKTRGEIAAIDEMLRGLR